MSTNSVLENLRKQWSKYNVPTTTTSRPGRPKQQPSQPKPKPQPALRTQFNTECYTCYAPVVFDTIWWNDFNNCYIPLDPDSMLEHRCKKRKQAKIFQTF